MPLALLALAIGGFGIGTTEFVIMGLLPRVAGDLGVDIPTAGHLISLYALGVVVGAPLIAAATVRVAKKRVLIGLMTLFVVGNLLSALAPTYGLLELARFLSGLPHGAFFGLGAVVAASLVDRTRTARAVSMMFLGLTVANVVGVPLGTLVGEVVGWRWTFGMVAAIGAVAVTSIALLIPRDAGAGSTGGSLRGELRALRRPQVLLTLAAVVFGFGGLFASYSYVAPMMTQVAGFAPSSITILLIVAGAGMTAGSLIGGMLADQAPELTLLVGLGAVAATLTGLWLGLPVQWLAATLLFLLGLFSLGLGPAVQARVMSLAGDAPSLVSAGIQSGFNIANSLGAWLGGLVIAAGWGFAAPNLVGAGLALFGLALLGVSLALEARRRMSAPTDKPASMDKPAPTDDPAPTDEPVPAV